MLLLDFHKTLNVHAKHLSLQNLELDGILNEFSESPEVVHRVVRHTFKPDLVKNTFFVFQIGVPTRLSTRLSCFGFYKPWIPG